MDLLTEEMALFQAGYLSVAGADEVGRGPLAGPVVCAAVILPLEEDKRITGIDDSKKLSAKKRAALAERIEQTARAFCIARVEAEVIDEINILQATRLCMKRAVEGLKIAPDFVLTDGNMTLDIAFPQRSIVKGDAKVCSIGAASILAKVYRDELMKKYHALYPEYGFDHNAGYGTKEHITAIKEVGICPIHRRTFVARFWDGRERRPSANI